MRHLRRLLEKGGCDLRLCHVPVWAGLHRAPLPGERPRGWRLILRLLGAYPRLVLKGLRCQRPDVFLVGYPGHLDMLFACALGRLKRAPVVFDIFLSLHETLVLDRRLVPAGSAVARLAGWLDRVSCRLADRVLTDTPENAAFFARLAGLPEDRFRVLWVGAEEAIFRPRPKVRPQERRVLFYGTFIPAQGVSTIVQAARLLESDGVQVRILGRGQESRAVDRLADELGLANLELVPERMVREEPEEICRAALCLGIFGESEKARRAIPHKVFECIAAGRPVLTGDTPAIRSAFRVGEEVAVCPVGNPEALAQAIRELISDPGRREAIGRAGRDRFMRDYSEAALSGMLRRHLEELVEIP